MHDCMYAFILTSAASRGLDRSPGALRTSPSKIHTSFNVTLTQRTPIYTYTLRHEHIYTYIYTRKQHPIVV